MIRAAVVLLALSAFTDAHAGRDRPSYALTSKTCVLSGTICRLRVSGPADGVGSITAEVSSAGGREDAVFAWDKVAGAWEAKLAAPHEGPLDVDLRVEDTHGAVLANTRTSVVAPWDDGVEGIGAVPLDDDPLTTIGLLRGEEGMRVRKARQLTVVSEGWDLDEAPKYAQIDLGDGTSVTIVANSFQRRAHHHDVIEATYDDAVSEFRLSIDGRRLTVDKANPTLADLSSPLCAEGLCVMLVEEADGYAISATQYRWDTAFPTDSVTVEISAVDKGGKVLFTQKSAAEFEDEVAVVFAQDVILDGDPVGGALGGKVRLLSDDGKALANGRFSAALTVDEGGDLDLGGVGVDDVAALEPVFGVLIGGEPSPCGDDGGWFAPPPLALPAGNGKGPKPTPPPTTTSDVLILFDMIDASGR